MAGSTIPALHTRDYQAASLNKLSAVVYYWTDTYDSGSDLLIKLWHDFYPHAQKVSKNSFLKVILSKYFCIEIGIKQLFIPTVITVTERLVSKPCQNKFSGIPAHFIQSGQRQSKGSYYQEGGDRQLQDGQEVS